MQVDTTTQRPIFICYRQIDGLPFAQWLYDVLRTTRLRDTPIYFDHTAPAGADWRVTHKPALERAGTLIVILTPGLQNNYGRRDAVRAELNWWLRHRSPPPILIDPYDDPRLIPVRIKKRWPAAQRVHVDRFLWANSTPDVAARSTTHVAEQVLSGIGDSSFAIVRQDYERVTALNQKFRFAVIILCVSLAVAAALAVVGRQQYAQAQLGLEEQRRQSVALRANDLAARSEQLIASDRAAALALAVEAASAADLPSVEHALHKALAETRHVSAYLHGRVDSLAFSADGERLYGVVADDGFGDVIGVHEWRLSDFAEIPMPFEVDRSPAPPIPRETALHVRLAEEPATSTVFEGGSGGCGCDLPSRVAFAVRSDGALVAAAIGHIVVWDGTSHRIVRRIVPGGRNDRTFFTKMAFVDRDTLVTWREGPSGGFLDRWSVRRGTRTARTLAFDRRYEKEAAFVRGGTRLLIVHRGRDRRVEAWDTTRFAPTGAQYCCLSAVVDSHSAMSDGEKATEQIVPAINDLDFLTITSNAERQTEITLWHAGSTGAVARLRFDHEEPEVFAALGPYDALATLSAAQGGFGNSSKSHRSPSELAIWWRVMNTRLDDGYARSDVSVDRQRADDDLRVRLRGERLAFNRSRDMLAVADDSGVTLAFTRRDETLERSDPGLSSPGNGLAVPRYDNRDERLAFLERSNAAAKGATNDLFHQVYLQPISQATSAVHLPTAATPLATDGTRLVFRIASKGLRIATVGGLSSLRVAGTVDETLALFNHSGSALAIAGKRVSILDPSTASILTQYDGTASARVMHLAFSADDARVVWSSGKELFIATTRPPYRSWRLPYRGSAISAIGFGARGDTLGVGNTDGAIEEWDVALGTQITATPRISESANGDVIAMALDAGNRLAVVTEDSLMPGTVRVYQYDDGQRRLLPLADLGSSTAIWWLAFTGSGDLIGIGHDGRITRWNMNADSWMKVACTKANLRFSPDERHRYFGSTTYQPRCDRGVLH